MIGADAASNASQAQVQASKYAIQAQENANALAQSNLQPFRYTGTGALNNLWSQFYPGGQLNQTPTLNLTGATGAPNLNYTLPTDPSLTSSFQASPGYQYNLQQQQQAIANSGAGKTGALSGNTLMALQQNASGLANQDFQQFYNNLTSGQLNQFNANNENYWNTYNSNVNAQTADYNASVQGQSNLYARLLAIAQMGQNAANQQGATGLSAATNIGQAQIGAGNAIAAGQIGSAQAISSGINNAISAFGGSNFGNTTGLGGSDLLNYLLNQGYGGGGSFAGGGSSQDGGSNSYS